MPDDGPRQQPDQIVLQALDLESESLCRELVRRVSRRVTWPCRLVTEPWTQPFPRIQTPGRDVVNLDKLLELVVASPHAQETILVGITSQDIATPLFAYHFGGVRPGSLAAVVSWARLCPAWYGEPEDLETTLRRAELEVLHELGHVWGLHHCRDFACVMRFAPTVEALDVRGTTFCRPCRTTRGAGRLPVH